jgi:hypothetical protein
MIDKPVAGVKGKTNPIFGFNRFLSYVFSLVCGGRSVTSLCINSRLANLFALLCSWWNSASLVASLPVEPWRSIDFSAI